jgi:phage anti-repressor protein
MLDITNIGQHIDNPQAITIELTQEIWEALGYTEKRNAVRALKRELIEGVDFCSFLSEVATTGVSAFGTKPETVYYLSYDGLKIFAAQSPGELGRTYRRYLIEVEKAYRTQIKATAEVKLLEGWRDQRLELSDVEPSYQAWCHRRRFSPSHTTNFIYLIVCEKRASELKMLELVEGEPTIAANYIPTSEELKNVFAIKLKLTKYIRHFADYKLAVMKAVQDIEH